MAMADSFTIRIPVELSQRLRDMAKEQNRSFNGLLVKALKEWLEENTDEEDTTK